MLRKLIYGLVIVAMMVASGCSPASPAQTTFTWSDSSELLTLVPCCQTTVDKNTRWLQEQLFDGLVKYAYTYDRQAGTAEAKIVPDLAESWSVSPDGLSWTFKLRKGVTFSDGSPLTAAEVKYSIEKSQGKDSPVMLKIGSIQEVRAVDESTVVITSKEPNSGLIHGLEDVGGLVQSSKSTPEKPIGTGPYVVKEWKPAEKVVLVLRDNYWGEKPKVQTLVYLRVPENVTRLIMLSKGEIDMTKITPEDKAQAEKTAGVVVETPLSSMSVGLRLNTRVEPYNKAEVRQAINYYLDKGEITKNVLLGAGSIPTGLAGPGVWGTVYRKEGWYPYDAAKADTLMTQAGMVKAGGKWQYNGKPLVLRLYTPEGRYLSDRLVAEYVGRKLDQAGFTVQHQIVPWSVGSSESRKLLNAKSIDAWMSGFSGIHPSLNFANHLRCSNKDTLETGFCDQAYDKLVIEAAASFDEKVQLQKYAQAQELAWAAAPYALLFDQRTSWAVAGRVQGLEFTPNEIPITDKISFK